MYVSEMVKRYVIFRNIFGSVRYNGKDRVQEKFPWDIAGWDEDSFYKFLLCQRSLPSPRAITLTISQWKTKYNSVHIFSYTLLKHLKEHITTTHQISMGKIMLDMYTDMIYI